MVEERESGVALAKRTGMFRGLKKAKARVDSNWEMEGHYLSRLDRVKIDQNRKEESAVFIEKTVLHVLDDADGKGHKVGENITHAIWAKHESFLGNVKGFLAGVLDMDPTEIGEDEMLTVADDDDQPLAGTVVENANRTILTREKQNPFTVINYKREVPPIELKEILSAEVIERYYPDRLLDRMIAFEKKEEAPTT